MHQSEILIPSTTTLIQSNEERQNHSINISHPTAVTTTSTSIYSRYRLPSTTTSAGTSISSSHNHDATIDYKRSYTLDSLSALAYFTSTNSISTELTPSAAIRDRYYQSLCYLQDNHQADELEDENDILEDEDDTTYVEATGDVLDYRPNDSILYKKPSHDSIPSIYSVNESIISLRTEYNSNGHDEDRHSITSVRTVDDQLQGRSRSLLGTNLNTLASKTAKKVSRSSSIFRHMDRNYKKGGNNDKKIFDSQPLFLPVRKQKDNLSIRSMDSTSLLSKLSKSTAPMRAKLSAISHLTRHSRIESSSNSSPPLTLPGRKHVAESVFNMPISSSSSALSSKKRIVPTNHHHHNNNSINSHYHKLKSPLEKTPPSFNFNLPRSLSASSSTASNSSNNKPIIGTNFVNEPTSLSHTSTTKEHIPLIYPALLSKVAEVFKAHIVLSTKSKDSIKYKDVFDGKEAVDKLALIIKSTDRNVALLLGRALDSQKFFHDVNYEHRLRDSSRELYQFKDHPMNLRPKSGVMNNTKGKTTVTTTTRSSTTVAISIVEEDNFPNGVFTLLTDCYSPTCTRERLCYSPRCPRRQEQAKRTNFHSPFKGHNREGSNSYTPNQQEDRLWINTVPKSILESLSKEETKRQENIFELIYTEKDFVDDLSYIKEQWIETLLNDNSIHIIGNRTTFVNTIFWNILEVLEVNSGLLEALLDRQSKMKVVDQIGDIMLVHVAKFEPFVQYGAHQIIGKYAFEIEKSTNPSFAEFVVRTERLPQSRKLELNGYLTKPTTRLGRYNLLLREILKHTPKNHPDQEAIPRVMTIIAKFLADVNKETGKTENAFNLQLLNERLVNKSISNFDLDLTAPNRQIIMKGTWKKGSGSESSEVLMYLLDHCLLIIKPKQNEEKYKLHRKPIPLALLSITFPDHSKRASTIIPIGRSGNGSFVDLSITTNTTISNTNAISADTYNTISYSNIYTNNFDTVINTNNNNNNNSFIMNKNGYPLSFVHLGKQSTGGPITLYATTAAVRQQWVNKIEEQRKLLVEKHKVFNIKPINERFFSSFNKVNCTAVFDNGRSLIFGGDQGVYLKKEGSGDELIRILAMDKVSQIDVLEQFNLILVLADKILYTYSLDTLLSTSETGVKRGRKISSHVSFFKVGQIYDKTATNINGSNQSDGVEKTLVCFVRNNAMTSTIRALEPCETTKEANKKKNKNNLGRLIRGNNEALKAHKDLYIPGEASSIQLFKNIICVGSERGFQMVNLSSAEVQSVLDPNDESNNLVLQQHENMKPISMFRHKNGSILLCYNELAFYIDKKGKRMRKDWSITWEGNPTAFAFRFPYVVAFNSNFIEIRHMDTGDLLQVIAGNNIRCLRPDSTDRIYGVMDDRIAGSEVIFQLKLVDPHRRKISMIKNNRNKA
ncbi:CNH domain-containing protein [Cokeromyces recurvatus]|uniref:CNH domain-containing protein n=1 Tax=Cokeromyces recurvatus TaxID=90255 RepID=UPI002220EB3D|nr:CNH domain-containing protein [Cokeromyces recurvatus]KAI7900280.1 CNH domain-containing protein [Cokeromyces recurvatus]